MCNTDHDKSAKEQLDKRTSSDYPRKVGIETYARANDRAPRSLRQRRDAPHIFGGMDKLVFAEFNFPEPRDATETSAEWHCAKARGAAPFRSAAGADMPGISLLQLVSHKGDYLIWFEMKTFESEEDIRCRPLYKK